MRAAQAVQRQFEGLFAGLLWAIRRVLALGFGRRRPRAPQLQHGRKLRILVVRLESRLGQLLMTTPLLATLRKRFATATIDCAVSPYAARVLIDHPAGVGLLPCQPYSWLASTSLLRTVRAMRRQRYDVCIDVSDVRAPSILQALACRLSGADSVIGFGGHALSCLYDAAVPAKPLLERDAHEIERALALLAPLGPGPTVRMPQVGPLAVSARAAMAAFVESHRGAPYVVVNLGARAAARRVLPADGALVANLCKAMGFCPVLVAGPNERALCEAVQALSLDVTVAPEANLPDLALLFSRASCTISGDAGSMHLAVAVGCPTLTLFSTTSASRSGYAAAPHAVVGPEATADERVWTGLVRQFLAGRREAWLGQRRGAARAAPTAEPAVWAYSQAAERGEGERARGLR